MEPKSGTIVIVTVDVEPAWEADMNRWYDEEHIPGLLAVPGYLSARRFVAVSGGPKYMSLYEVASPEVRSTPEYRKVVGTPWTERLRGHRTSQLAVYRQIFPAEGVIHGTAWGDGTTTVGGMVTTRTDVAPENESDFNAWYNEQHLFTLCKVPGVISARRFRVVEGAPPYLAQYELVSPEVQAQEQWQGANATPWAVRARGNFTTRWRTVYRPL